MGSERRWWGWGDQVDEQPLGPVATELLDSQFGAAQPWLRPDSFEQIALHDARPLPVELAESITGIEIFTGQEQRVRYALGKGYADLARLRMGRLENAPDAVLEPQSAAALPRLLAACSGHSVAAVPFGGGTSVVGGVEALRGRHSAVVSIDLRNLKGVEIDRTSLTAKLGAGLRGPEAEAALNAQGFTLGHFPQSFEWATIGGFAATRSAGQASNGYGRFDELVSSLSMITPIGTIESLRTPHTAAGPSLRQLMLGSEGCLGVISDVSVRVRPMPAQRRYEAWFCENFEAGCELARKMSQAGVAPDVFRLSDEAETAVSVGMSSGDGGGLKEGLLKRYLRLRSVEGGCLIIAGWEGDLEPVRRRRAASARLMRSLGGVYLGQSGGQSWVRGRFNGPYLRDILMDRGLMVETLETSHTWSSLRDLYASVGSSIEQAMAARGTPGIVLCHLSHSYPDGASLYFTFICRAELEDPLRQWSSVKKAASEAIVAAGGTITHHHGVGRDHLPWMEAEVGEAGIEALQALKERFDPAGILNPGKLIPGV